MINNTLLTYTGKTIQFPFPDYKQIDIRDIARGLSRTPRFSGQTYSYYSVARHSILVAKTSASRLELSGLMHDASEAYMGDVPSPCKSLVPDYSRIEKNLSRAIDLRFGIKQPESMIEVKLKDYKVMKAEFLHFFPDKFDEFFNDTHILPEPLNPEDFVSYQDFDEIEFIEYFHRLTSNLYKEDQWNQ